MSTLITDTNDVTRFTAVFADAVLAHDLAPQLECREVEALAGILRALGEPASANMWINAHAPGDEEGDQHYQPLVEPYIVPLNPMGELQCDGCQ